MTTVTTGIKRDDAIKIRDLLNRTEGLDIFIKQITEEMGGKQPILMRDQNGNTVAAIYPDDALLVRQAQLDVLVKLRTKANADLDLLGVGPAPTPAQAAVNEKAARRKAANRNKKS